MALGISSPDSCWPRPDAKKRAITTKDHGAGDRFRTDDLVLGNCGQAGLSDDQADRT